MPSAGTAWLLASPAEHSRGSALQAPLAPALRRARTPPLVPRGSRGFHRARTWTQRTGCTAQNAALQVPTALPPTPARRNARPERLPGAPPPAGMPTLHSDPNHHPSPSQQPPKTPAAESLAGCDGRTDQCPNRQACGVTPRPKVHNSNHGSDPTTPTRISNRRHSIDRQLACRIRNSRCGQVDDAPGLSCCGSSEPMRRGSARPEKFQSIPFVR